MTLKIYNTLTKKKEAFKPLKGKNVSMYTCGPTVYDYAHIGNFRTYVFQDLLKRYLKYKRYEVKQVMNLTDVDDKTIKGSTEQGIPLREFTDKYTTAFFDDMKTLNIEPADIYPRATETIKDMVELVKKLLEKEIAYKTEDGIYYNIKKFKEYGKLSGVNIENLKAGARVSSDNYDKENAQDFVLWKFWKKEDGPVFWETEIGKGRPGWHMECSVMSMKHLGETFDIHTGGVDLIFPHHENEIAQSEGATGKQFVKYWLHAEHLLVEGKKMSKSLGNFYTLRDLIEKGHDSRAIRYILMSTHYKQKLNFTFEELDAAKSTVDRFFEFENRLESADGAGTEMSELIHSANTSFEASMDDDLDINTALAGVFDFMHKINKLIDSGKVSKNNAKEVLIALYNFDQVLGILSIGKKKISKDLEKNVNDLIKKRETARANKDFETSDQIREELAELGVEVQDTDAGQKWKLK